jgi:cytoskeletal protein CcmA (bactofilin family)
MAINPTEFANVQLTDDFNTWRTRTNKTLGAFSTNTVTTSNTVHSNGTPKAITYGHATLRGTLSANQLYANSYLSGGEFGNPDTLTITTNNYTYGKLTVANNATIGLDGEDELLSRARLRVTANATFREIVRMDANVFIGTANTDTLVVNAVSIFDGEATFRDDVVVTANVDITGDSVNITGNTVIGSANTDTLAINATTDINAATNIDGNVTATGKVTINGNTVIGNANTDTLIVGADATFNGPVTLNGVTDVSGTMVFNGNTTLGNASTDKLIVPSHSVFQSNVTVGDAASDKLLVTGHAQLSSNLIVEGTTKLNGGTTIGNATGDDLTVTARVASSFVPKTDGVHSLGTTSLRWEELFADSVTAGNTSLGGTLSVDGSTALNGLTTTTFTANGAVDINSTLNVDGATTLNGAVTIGNATSDDLTFTGRAASSLVPKTDGVHTLGTTSLRWEELFADSITAGNAALSGTLDVTGDTTVDGATILNGAVTLGNATGDDLTFTGRAASSLVPKTDGAFSLGSNSLRWEQVYADNITAGNVALSGTFDVNGTSTLNGNVILGNANTDAVTINGTTEINGAATIDGVTTITGEATINGNTTIGTANSDTLTVESGSTFNASSEFKGNLTVQGKATFNGNTTIDGQLSLGSGFTLSATEGIYDSLRVNDHTTLGSSNTDIVRFRAEANSSIVPHIDDTYDLGINNKKWRNIYIDGTAFLDAINLNGTAITSTAAEINILDGVTATASELNILDGVTSTASELNILDGVTSTTAEINKLDGFTGTVTDLNYAKDLRATGVTTTEFDKLDGLTATTSELNILDGVTATTTELNYTDGVTSNIQTQLNAKLNLSGGTMTGNTITLGIRPATDNTYDLGSAGHEYRNAYIDGTAFIDTLNLNGTEITSTAADINKLDGFTGVFADLNYAKDLRATGVTTTEFDKLDGLTATTSELNILDGVTATAAEINKLDGFTGTVTDLNYAKDLRATGVTSTEFDYLDGVTSNIQTQINAKLNLSGGTLTGTLTSRSITPSANATYDIGTSDVKFRNYYASGEFVGTATTAKFADLAEKYIADADYDEGTVIVVGGEAEVTSSTEETKHSVLGVVSLNPAFKMNAELENGTYIALKGRVPVKILGEVSKGDRLVATDNGCAKTTRSNEWTFAIALEDGTDGIIEAVIL